MITLPGFYILSMIDHKTEYHGLIIAKWMDNNLRERNPQLGKVEGICEENSFGLVVGDVVAVHHLTFYGNIGTDKQFTWQDHVEVDGIKYFKTPARNIFFKYSSLELLGDTVLCTDVADIKTLKMDDTDGKFMWDSRFDNKGVLDGRRVIVKAWAFYCIEIDQQYFFKVNRDEIVAYLDPIEPTENCIVVEYLPEKEHSLFDLSGVKKTNNVKARVVNGNGYYEDGSILWVFRNNGVSHDGYWILDVKDEIVIGSWGRVDEQDIDKLKVVA